MNQGKEQAFKETIVALETLIRQLERNVGVQHKASPFDHLLPLTQEKVVEKVAQQENKEEQKAQEQPQVNQPEQAKEKKQGQQNQKSENKDKPDLTADAKDKEAQPQQKQQQKPKAKPAANVGVEIPLELVEVVTVDIRVGRIVECIKHPESVKIFCLKVDIGTEIREIGTGLQGIVPEDQMTGLVCILSNLKPRKLAGYMSNGMVLCASNQEHSKIEILRPNQDCKVGERFKLQGYENLFKDEMEPQLNPKKKNWENVQALLKTNNKLEATFNGIVYVASQGPALCQSLVDASIS